LSRAYGAESEWLVLLTAWQSLATWLTEVTMVVGHQSPLWTCLRSGDIEGSLLRLSRYGPTWPQGPFTFFAVLLPPFEIDRSTNGMVDG
jgi:hypothetical protein